MEERRIKTFIELTRRALDEEYVGESDFPKRGRLSIDHAHGEEKKRRGWLAKKR